MEQGSLTKSILIVRTGARESYEFEFRVRPRSSTASDLFKSFEMMLLTYAPFLQDDVDKAHRLITEMTGLNR